MSAFAAEIQALVAQLDEAKENLEIRVARLMKREAAELRHLIADLELRIAERTAIVEAAGARVEKDERGRTRVVGGWVDADQRALARAVGLATFNLEQATGKVAPFRAQWPPLPKEKFERAFAAELKAEAAAETALRLAEKALSESTALLEADRTALMELKARRAA